MSLSNAAENSLNLLVYNNTDFANIGNAGGLRGSTVAGSFYISLHTAFPGEGGDQTTSEAAYTSYARVAVARSSAGFTCSGNGVVNAATITFPASTGGGENEVFYFGIGTDSSGAGNLFSWACLGTNLGPFAAIDTSGENISIPAHGLNVDDRIAFFPEASELALPTGLTAGTVYWTKTVTDTDRVIVSATQGGAAVNITAVGRGVAFKMIGLKINNNITPVFSAGALIVRQY